MTLAELVQQHTLDTLQKHYGCVSKAAAELGIYRSTLQRMLRRWRAPTSTVASRARVA